MKDSKISLKSKILYGVGDLYGGGSFFIIGALLLVFLTDVVGLRPILAGLVIMIGKIWDAITDPAMGYISDNTRSKYGRRRLYFLIGIIPIAISFLLLWINIGTESEAIKFLYYLFTYILFSTVFTMVMVPYNSMPAEMSSDYKERSSLIGVRMAFSQVGALLGAVLPMTIIKSFDDPAVGYRVMGIGFGIFYALGFIFVFFGTYEKNYVQKTKDEEGLIHAIKKLVIEFFSTTRNKALRIHIIMYLCAYVAMDIFNALLIYFLRDYLGKNSIYQLLLGVVLLSQIGALYFVSRSCSKDGNAKTYRKHVAIWMFGIVFLGLFRPTTPVYMILIVGAIIGIGLSGGVMIPYNMLAFVTDADQVITRKRREGTYAGMMTFVRKIAQALAIFSVGLALQLLNYQEGIVQSQSTIIGIRILFITAPAIFLVIGIWASTSFKISPSNHKIMMAEIERLKAGGKKEDVTDETRVVCENITGIKYEYLWGYLLDNHDEKLDYKIKTTN